MRCVIALAVAAASCAGPRTGPAEPVMSSSVLDHQNPRGTDSEHHEITRSSSRNWFERMFGLNEPSFPYLQLEPQRPTEHYYGCHGCTTGGDAGLGVIAAALVMQRRRRSGAMMRA